MVLYSILFLISQTSYRTYKIISSYELARPIMGTIFLVYMSVGWSVCLSWAKMRRRNYVHHAHAQSHFGAVKIDPCSSFRLYGRVALARTKKKRTLRNGKLKASRASATEDRGTKGRG